MSRCSYTWKEWDEEKGEYIEGQCPEKIWLGSEEYCIFYDPSLDKDTELFEQKLKEKLVKKDFNFRGYFFPEWAIFENIEFEEAVDFYEATFQKDAAFYEATFQSANFSGATSGRGSSTTWSTHPLTSMQVTASITIKVVFWITILLSYRISTS